MGTALAKKGSISIKKCAFCSSFYDPAHSAIKPRQGQKDIWEYNTNIMKPCLQRSNRMMASQNTCPKFQCKI